MNMKSFQFEAWDRIPNLIGSYKFEINSKCTYEIFIECYYFDTPIETAKASLCITKISDNSVITREWIEKELPIQELTALAEKHYMKNFFKRTPIISF